MRRRRGREGEKERLVHDHITIYTGYVGTRQRYTAREGSREQMMSPSRQDVAEKQGRSEDDLHRDESEW